jgi:hypothetical protein
MAAAAAKDADNRFTPVRAARLDVRLTAALERVA